MESIDPATGRPLPADAIQRILFIANSVHVYNIPPQTSAKGHTAAAWTEDPKRHITTCRMRVIETSIPSSEDADDTDAAGGENGDDSDEKVKVDIVLEDKASGQLFAAAPYTTRAAVEPAQDSSRFFALRVQDEAGRKATLGVGFEERGEAFDFGVALQEAQKMMEGGAGLTSSSGGATAARQGGGEKAAAAAPVKRDYSLKEGETITVNLSGTRFGRRARPQPQQQEMTEQQQSPVSASASPFSLPPPPPPPSRSSGGGGGGPVFLPPPPSAQQVRAERRRSAQDMGFDDGLHDEFA